MMYDIRKPRTTPIINVETPRIASLMFFKTFFDFCNGGFRTDFNSLCAISFNLLSENPVYSGLTKNKAFSKYPFQFIKKSVRIPL